MRKHTEDEKTLGEKSGGKGKDEKSTWKRQGMKEIWGPAED